MTAPRRSAILAALVTIVAIPASAQAPRPAEPNVAARNRAVLSELPFADRQDFDDAMRGFVATVPDSRNPRQYQFLQGDAPPSVNPSLWRLAQLNAINGLFAVVDGMYQVRGFSLANMTIVEGRTGIIVIDPLSTVGAAKEGLELYFAPAGFMDAAVSEFVIAGNAMGRRAQYQFGGPLPRGERGNVDAGLGKNDSRGAGGRSIVPPTDSISQPVDTRTIDGVSIVFHLAPSSEAPAEMHLYFPELRVIDTAENATHTLHNLLPLRGTEVRDAKGWSRYLGEALERFGPDAQVLIAQHHWPVWGHDRVVQHLEQQRDLYKYVHDQSVRMMNQGMAPTEIAEGRRLPRGLEQVWSARGYYGTLSHDSKAVYQRYLGWYDGNPAVLNALPPEDSAKKAVEYMGGAQAIIARAREDYRQGNYRWVAQVMDQVVYAEPANAEARTLAADAFEQLGYLAESATWRNAYLLGAQELRSGVPAGRARQALDAEMITAMPAALVFDYLGTTLNGPRAENTKMVLNWRFTDTGEALASTLDHAALTYVPGKSASNADASVTTTRSVFNAIVLRQRTFADSQQRGDMTITGNGARFTELMTLFDDFDPAFHIVEPRRKP